MPQVNKFKPLCLDPKSPRLRVEILSTTLRTPSGPPSFLCVSHGPLSPSLAGCRCGFPGPAWSNFRESSCSNETRAYGLCSSFSHGGVPMVISLSAFVRLVESSRRLRGSSLSPRSRSRSLCLSSLSLSRSAASSSFLFLVNRAKSYRRLKKFKCHGPPRDFMVPLVRSGARRVGAAKRRFLFFTEPALQLRMWRCKPAFTQVPHAVPAHFSRSWADPATPVGDKRNNHGSNAGSPEWTEEHARWPRRCRPPPVPPLPPLPSHPPCCCRSPHPP